MAIFHCQACAYGVTCLADSPVTLICFIGVIRHDHSPPEELQPGWFTELLLSLGFLSGKLTASSPGIVGNKRVSKIGRLPGDAVAGHELAQQTGIAFARQLELKPNPHRSTVGRVWSCAP